jgi:Lipocalin-like domain/CrtC N-terminal lipocalin domain
MTASTVVSAALPPGASRRKVLGLGGALTTWALAPVSSLGSPRPPAPAGSLAGRAENEIFPPLFDPVACLAHLPNVIRNSWFLIAHVETAAGHKFNCLVHQIINSAPGEPLRIASILNITDISHRKYRGEERMHANGNVELATDRMRNVTPTSTIAGDHRAIGVQADFGWGALDFKADFPGHIMLNGGCGVFDFMGGTPTVQYSIPWGKGAGWLSLDGVRHAATGTFWFDRQWGMLQGLFGQPATPVNPKDNWIWMDLNLSNGIVLGLWDLELGGRRRSWVTALHPDGTHVIAAIEPLAAHASAVWTSPATGQRYPTRFKIRIDALDCSLDVVAVMQAQEIVSPTEPKYEGVATLSGSYGGKSVTGFTLIEMVGDWRG